MKFLPFLFVFSIIFPLFSFAQENGLPKAISPLEMEMLDTYHAPASSGITNPPYSPVRTMAEWEEIQSLVITWTSYPEVLREIVRYAKEECEVIIVCSNATSVRNYLQNYGIDDTNVTFVVEDFDSVWVRDYGQNSVYTNDVDSLLLIDWIYNRPRYEDDLVPERIASEKGIPIYSTTSAPFDLVHTGGNFMADGLGTGFSSNLVLEENGPGGSFNETVKNEAQIDQIMNDFMGINRYIKMETLPYDGIHHIDMHMKLLDEERLVVGEYPTGVADGPQIEANIQYVLSNFNSAFGEPYEIVRLQMPPDANDQYPDSGGWNPGDYRTYTNMVFVNKTILVPVYEEQYDSTALRIIRESNPGYRVEGIDCNDIIQASGALHCITKAVGVNDPLWIVHQSLKDTYDNTDYVVDATIKHKTGIDNATLFYQIDNNGTYFSSPMTLVDMTNDIWSGNIPGQVQGTNIKYYVHATADNGKEQVRPIVAPNGYWEFDVLEIASASNDIANLPFTMAPIFPNPASEITCIPIFSNQMVEEASIQLKDVLGRTMEIIHQGKIAVGESKFFFNAKEYSAGTYFVEFSSEKDVITQKIFIK